MKDFRDELDRIDYEMRVLFEKRLDVVKKVAQYKIENNIPVLDEKREAFIIERGLENINNLEYAEYYKEFIELQLKVSKELQKKLIK